jgi:hypothetical protein
MQIPAILGHGVLLIASILAAIARPASRERAESRKRIPLDRLPDSASLAGVPIRLLLSERSGPGAMLRDTLMIRPPTRDH